MTNDELWERIKSLSGHLVTTHHRLNNFTVVQVNDTGVVIRGGVGRQAIPRGTIEAAYALGRNSQALSPAQIQAANLDGYDAGCLVAILNAVGAERE
jgi:hypothetical protein